MRISTIASYSVFVALVVFGAGAARADAKDCVELSAKISTVEFNSLKDKNGHISAAACLAKLNSLPADATAPSTGLLSGIFGGSTGAPAAADSATSYAIERLDLTNAYTKGMDPALFQKKGYYTRYFVDCGGAVSVPAVQKGFQLITKSTSQVITLKMNLNGAAGGEAIVNAYGPLATDPQFNAIPKLCERLFDQYATRKDAHLELVFTVRNKESIAINPFLIAIAKVVLIWTSGPAGPATLTAALGQDSPTGATLDLLNQIFGTDATTLVRKNIDSDNAAYELQIKKAGKVDPVLRVVALSTDNLIDLTGGSAWDSSNNALDEAFKFNFAGELAKVAGGFINITEKTGQDEVDGICGKVVQFMFSQPYSPADMARALMETTEGHGLAYRKIDLRTCFPPKAVKALRAVYPDDAAQLQEYMDKWAGYAAAAAAAAKAAAKDKPNA